MESSEKLGQTEDRLSLFPPEVLIKIFQYLPTGDLLLNVARVSKKFSKLTKDPAVHCQVSIPRRYPAIKFLERATLIQSLEIVTRKNEHGIYEEGNPLVNPSCELLLMAVSRHASLREVVIIGTRVRMGSLKSLSRGGLLSRLYNLVIEVSPNGSLGQTCEDRLAVLEAKKRGLKHLEVEFEKLRNANGFKSLTHVSISSSLKLKFAYRYEFNGSLNLWNGNVLPEVTSLVLITVEKEDQIYPIFATVCPNLTHLSLICSNYNISSQTIKDMVVLFPKLETLTLDFLGGRFSASWLFDRDVGRRLQNLKHIRLDRGFYVVDRAQAVFKNIPSINDVKHRKDLIVKDTETVDETVNKATEWVCRLF
jgi:hypothetical protein